ncbi:MAG: DUF1780 domain-containing protein [bacterium]
MNEMDRKYLQKLRDRAIDTRTFLSNKMKSERERAVCRAFLRTIGISFEESEIIAPSTEPADVSFRTARFQIRDLLEPDRKRGDDWKKREQRYLSAGSLDDVMVPFSLPIPLGLGRLAPVLEITLSAKAQKYKENYKDGCTEIDALVYVALKDRFLAVNSRLPDLEGLKTQGWRSVSLLFSPFGMVLFTGSTAPEILRAIPPAPHMEWQDIDTLFESRKRKPWGQVLKYKNRFDSLAIWYVH